jgi:hypothetical protein
MTDDRACPDVGIDDLLVSNAAGRVVRELEQLLLGAEATAVSRG